MGEIGAGPPRRILLPIRYLPEQLDFADRRAVEHSPRRRRRIQPQLFLSRRIRRQIVVQEPLDLTIIIAQFATIEDLKAQMDRDCAAARAALAAAPS